MLYWFAVFALLMLLVGAVWLVIEFLLHAESLGT